MIQSPATTPFDAQIVTSLKANVPDLLAIYRYGSAGGEYQRAESDIDVALMAKHKLATQERYRLAAELVCATHRDVDLHDMHDMPLTLRIQIVMSGARIYAANDYAAGEFDSRTLSDYVRLNEERKWILEDIRTRGRIYA